MSVPLTGVAGFFTRQGAIIGEYNRVAALYGSGLDDGFFSIWSQFASSDQAAVSNLPAAVSSYKSSGQSYQSTLVGDGQQAMLLQVADDTSVVPYSLQRALQILVDQMGGASQSINRATVSGTVTPDAGNLGDTTVVFSNTNIYGDPLDTTYAETITITCTANSGSSYAASLKAVGQALVASNLSTWPGGSGSNASLTVVDPAVDGIVKDGGFSAWSGTGNDTPTNWVIINGDAGVTIFKSAGAGVRTGTDAAKIQSDGAQATQLGQTVSLSVNTVYAVCVYAKINSLDASGTFRIALTDDNGTVLTDDAGNNLSYTRDLNGEVTTSYQIFTAFFSTPRQLPVTTRVQYGFSAAPTSGRFLTIDLAAVVAATPLYGSSGTGTSGPFVAAFAGANRTALNDFYSLVVTNDLTSQSFALGMQRLYDTRGLGIAIPSAVSETIPDSLVTH